MHASRFYYFVVPLAAILLMLLGATVYIRTQNDASGTASRVATSSDTEQDATPRVRRSAAVVSNHELATDAGAEILRKGGTAADAAVAVAAVLSVVEPWFSSVLGGGTWGLYYDAELGVVTSLDGVGPTGSKATAANYAGRASAPGMHQAIVPGAWDGWMVWLMEYGELGLDDVLAPAIKIAREGYPASKEMITWLERQRADTLARPDAARIYAPGGTLVAEGETVYQHDMAETFEALANAYTRSASHEAGIQAARDHFYRGPLAEAIVAFSDQQNGYLTLDDFHDFEAQIVTPINTTYRDDITVYQNPPNSQGIVMLLALNILRGFDLGAHRHGSAESMHLQAEALKLAFADRYYHVGDPVRVSVPTDELLSDAHADRQRARISLTEAMEWPIADALATDPSLTNTTSFHIVDHDGNGAAVTTSLGAQFLVVGNTGIHINHRMRFLALADGDPNQVAAGYKVRHTSNPYIALRNNELYLLGGNTGADTQSQGQVQQFINVVEYGMGAQEAVAAPRFVSTAFPSTVYSYQVRNTLQLERSVLPTTVQALYDLGHTVSVGEGTFGSANMIVREQNGSFIETGAEPRLDTAKGVVLTP